MAEFFEGLGANQDPRIAAESDRRLVGSVGRSLIPGLRLDQSGLRLAVKLTAQGKIALETEERKWCNSFPFHKALTSVLGCSGYPTGSITWEEYIIVIL